MYAGYFQGIEGSIKLLLQYVSLLVTTPIVFYSGWPFLVGAALAVLFAIVSGLSRGEVERSFLPFFPWLLVAAVAPEPGPAPRGAVASPVLLIAVGAATAVILQAVLRTAW